MDPQMPATRRRKHETDEGHGRARPSRRMAPGEPGPQVEAARHGRDDLALGRADERAHAAVGRLRAKLQPAAEARGNPLDVAHPHAAEDLLEVAREDPLLLRRGRPEARLADALAAVLVHLDRHPEHARELAPHPRRRPLRRSASASETAHTNVDSRGMRRRGVHRDRLELDARGRGSPTSPSSRREPRGRARRARPPCPCGAAPTPPPADPGGRGPARAARLRRAGVRSSRPRWYSDPAARTARTDARAPASASAAAASGEHAAGSREAAETIQGLRAGLAVFARRRDDVLRVAYTRDVRQRSSALARWAASHGVPCREMTRGELDRIAESAATTRGSSSRRGRAAGSRRRARRPARAHAAAPPSRSTACETRTTSAPPCAARPSSAWTPPSSVRRLLTRASRPRPCASPRAASSTCSSPARRTSRTRSLGCDLRGVRVVGSRRPRHDGRASASPSGARRCSSWATSARASAIACVPSATPSSPSAAAARSSRSTSPSPRASSSRR